MNGEYYSCRLPKLTEIQSYRIVVFVWEALPRRLKVSSIERRALKKIVYREYANARALPKVK